MKLSNYLPNATSSLANHPRNNTQKNSNELHSFCTTPSAYLNARMAWQVCGSHTHTVPTLLPFPPTTLLGPTLMVPTPSSHHAFSPTSTTTQTNTHTGPTFLRRFLVPSLISTSFFFYQCDVSSFQCPP